MSDKSEKKTIQIKNRWTQGVLFECEAETVKDALTKAVREGAYLKGAYLKGADLEGAYLKDADLNGAYLKGAYLKGADLKDADLNGADLKGADLKGADLKGADLEGAYLNGAYLEGAKNIPAIVAAQSTIAPEGSLIVWKKCRQGVMVKLRIPEEARRSNATGRKCRAEFVDVLEVHGAETGISSHDAKITYRVGERVHCHEWNEDRWIECAGGIHFFLTRLEAETY